MLDIFMATECCACYYLYKTNDEWGHHGPHCGVEITGNYWCVNREKLPWYLNYIQPMDRRRPEVVLHNPMMTKEVVQDQEFA